jgi:hypothetical protein
MLASAPFDCAQGRPLSQQETDKWFFLGDATENIRKSAPEFSSLSGVETSDKLVSDTLRGLASLDAGFGSAQPARDGQIRTNSEKHPLLNLAR